MNGWQRKMSSMDEWDVPVEDQTVPVDGAEQVVVTVRLGDLVFGYFKDMVRPEENCPECWMVHAPDAPHYPFHAFFEIFTKKHGRFPHWSDAVAHCPPEVREKIKAFLDARGQWSEPKEGMPQEDAVARQIGGMLVHSSGVDPSAKVFALKVDLGETVRKATQPFVFQPNTDVVRERIKDAILTALKGRNVDIKMRENGDKIEADVTFEGPAEATILFKAVDDGGDK